MKKNIFILLSACILIPFKAFPGGPGDYAPVIKQQANAMGYALMKNDYKTYLKYTDPRVIKTMGGADAFIDTLKHFEAQRKHYGASFFQIDVEEPAWVIDSAGELQTTVPVTTQMRVKGGLVTSTTTMIGLSKDKGKNWVFIDTAEGIKSIRNKYKDISSRLSVPVPPAPKFQSN